MRKEICDWIERWGERYEGFVEFEDDEEGEEGAGRSRDGKGAGKGRDKEKEKERKSKRLERYLRGMRENGGFLSLVFERFAHLCFFFSFLSFLGSMRTMVEYLFFPFFRFPSSNLRGPHGAISFRAYDETRYQSRATRVGVRDRVASGCTGGSGGVFNVCGCLGISISVKFSIRIIRIGVNPRRYDRPRRPSKPTEAVPAHACVC